MAPAALPACCRPEGHPLPPRKPDASKASHSARPGMGFEAGLGHPPSRVKAAEGANGMLQGQLRGGRWDAAGAGGGGPGPCLQVGPRPRCTQGQPTQGCEPQGRRALLYGMGSTMQRCELSRRHRGAHSEACLRAITWQRMHAPYTACITSSCSRWVGRSRILRQRNNSRAAGATSSPRPLEVGGSYGKCLLLLCWNPLTIRASLLCPMVWQL